MPTGGGIVRDMNEKRELLRHAVAALAYRATRALENAPEEFASFAGAGRTPAQILAHMGDLFDWAISLVRGKQVWHNSDPLPWSEENERFFRLLGQFDAAVSGWEGTDEEIERLIQGPIADALTHVGQIAMMRRMAGCPTRGENFYVAAIHAGQVGADQPAPVRTF